MSFLSPIFLWLLPLTAIPLIIHLLNRRNLFTMNFSSLRFLKLIERESIRKLQILQLLLLILRTIIIISIILMVSRPVFRGVFNMQNTSESALNVIILDNSFSMKGNENKVEHTVDEILKQIPNNNQLILINLNGGLQYMGLREDVPEIGPLCKLTYKSGAIIEALSILAEIKEENYISHELYILTDAQSSSIIEFQNYSEELEIMNIYAFIAPKLENNLSISWGLS